MTFETTAQETYVTLRVYHPQLDPEQLNGIFECRPSHSWRINEELVVAEDGSTRKATTGGWLLSSKHAVRSLDVKDHLAWLIKQLTGHGGTINRLQKAGYTTDVVVAWFSDSWNTCPALTPQHMQDLANLRLPLWFDVYLNEEGPRF